VVLFRVEHQRLFVVVSHRSTMSSLYQSAADIVTRILNREATTRAVFELGDSAATPAVHALVCESIKRRDAIAAVIERSPTMRDAVQRGDVASNLALVLVYEL